MTASESLTRAPKVQIAIPVQRPTSWWLDILKRRAERMYEEKLAEDGPGAISVEAAEKAARREHVEVTSL